MVLEVYFIRHAESETNLDLTHVAGQSNWAKLTENGIAQAKALGKRLKSIRFDAVYSSPAARAKQTAEYCLRSMGADYHVNLEPRLLEIDQGDWQGRPRDEIYNREDVVKGLAKDCWHFIPGDNVKGESQAAVAKRMRDWLEGLKDGRIAAFSHGVAIKFLLADLFDRDKRTAYRTPIDNTSITIVRYDDKYSLVLENDTSHLDKAGLPKVKGTFD